jgi:Flp pilus assembly pilin Flp
MNKPVQASLGNLLKRVHADERGAVSLETILVVAAIAIPVLIFILKVGWPKLKDMFEENLKALEGHSEGIHSPTDGSGIRN